MNIYVDNIKNVVLKFLDNEPAEVFLYGSRARGDAHSGSDVDVGLLFKRNPQKRITVLKEMINNCNYSPLHQKPASNEWD